MKIKNIVLSAALLTTGVSMRACHKTFVSTQPEVSAKLETTLSSYDAGMEIMELNIQYANRLGTPTTKQQANAGRRIINLLEETGDAALKCTLDKHNVAQDDCNALVEASIELESVIIKYEAL